MLSEYSESKSEIPILGSSGLARIWASPVAVLAVLAVALTGSVHAHHNFASDYDPDSMLVVRGTVAQVRYANPHIRVVIELVADDRKPLRDAQSNPVRSVSPIKDLPTILATRIYAWNPKER